MLREFRRITISRTDRIGDVVLSLPVFASLKQCFPDCELSALVQGYTAEVAASFHAVDDVTTYEKSEFILTTTKKLRSLRTDAILFLYPRFCLAVAAILAGIPVRVGSAYRWYSFLYNRRVHEHRKDSVKSEAEYNMSLARAIGCTTTVLDIRLEVDQNALGKAKAFLASNNIGRFVAVHPGSGGSAADWSAANFRELCEGITEHPGTSVVITGSAPESDLCSQIAAGNPRCLNSAGAFTIREFIALLSLADSFVSNSTGPIHLAASVGTPVVGIYPNNKPMTPARWAPIVGRKIILTPPDGSDDLTGVAVADVLRSVQDFLKVKSQ